MPRVTANGRSCALLVAWRECTFPAAWTTYLRRQ